MVIADEMNHDVEHLRFDANHLCSATQFVAVGVEDEGIESPDARFDGHR